MSASELNKLIEELDALAEKATPGPWRHSVYMSGTQNVEFPGSRGISFMDQVMAEDGSMVAYQSDADATRGLNLIRIDHRPADKGNDADPERTANAMLIVALRNALPELLAHCERLKGENESLRAECGVRQIDGYQTGYAAALERAAQLVEEMATFLNLSNCPFPDYGRRQLRDAAHAIRALRALPSKT